MIQIQMYMKSSEIVNKISRILTAHKSHIVPCCLDTAFCCCNASTKGNITKQVDCSEHLAYAKAMMRTHLDTRRPTWHQQLAGVIEVPCCLGARSCCRDASAYLRQHKQLQTKKNTQAGQSSKDNEVDICKWRCGRYKSSMMLSIQAIKASKAYKASRAST